MASSQDPFFPDPLDDYKPKPNFPFDDRSEDDWTEDKSCPVCTIPLEEHSTKQIVECAIMELRYPKNSESKRGEKH